MSVLSALSGDTYTTSVPVASDPADSGLDQPVEAGEEGGQRLAGSGGRGDQHVAPSLQHRPGAPLRLGRRGEPASKPFGDEGMKVEHCVSIIGL